MAKLIGLSIKRCLPLFTGLLLSLTSIAAYSFGAGLLLSPQSLILTGQSRSGTVHVVNRGNRTGVFAVRWIDHSMTQEGKLHTWKDPEQSPWSLQPHIRFSPRRVTLAPGENQVIRVALKSTQGVPQGEYFSHLNVITLNKNVEESIKQLEKPQETAAGVSISSRTGMSIPVIWRNTDEQPAAVVKIEKLDLEKGKILLEIARQGIVSTRGYIHLIHRHNGVESPLGQPHPFVIYANIDSRSLSLDIEKVTPADGEIEVYYSEDAENIHTLLGRSSIKL